MGIEAAIAAALASAIGETAAAAVASFIVSAATSVVIGALSSALMPKPKTPNLSNSFTSKAQGITQNVKQAITSRRIIYGEVRVGGALTFIEATNDNKYLHIVLTLADHEVESIGEIWLNDVSIPPDYIDGSGNIVSGKFAGKVRIKKHLGLSTQTADSDLVAETSADTNFKGQGIAYIYVRLEYDRNTFATGIPNITAFVKGRKVLDPRDSTTKYTANGALLVYDYLRLQENELTPGIGADSTSIDETQLNSSANVCDEIVTTTNITETVSSIDTSTDIISLDATKLQFQTGDRVSISTTGTLPGGLSSTYYYVITYQHKDTPRIKLAASLENALAGNAVNITSQGSGTISIIKNGEPRYHGGGVILTEEEVGHNLSDLLTIMGGSAIYVGGSWKIKAAVYSTPSITFNESHLVSPITVKTKTTRRERFNLVKGVYVSPLNDGEPADYPPVKNSTYATNDGKTIPVDYDLPMTQRPHTAMRLAKIKLEKARQELFISASFSLHAMQIQPGDVVYIDNSRLGWSSKPFEVVSWSLDKTEQNNTILFYVNMTLQETASSVYDWNNGEETVVDPAPDTDLPDPTTVEVVTGFSLDSVLVDTQSGDKTFNVRATWNLHTNPFVINNGKYEIEYKETTDSMYSSAGSVDGEITEMILPALKPDVLYDIRIFAYNNLGAKSATTEINNFLVGTTATTNTEDWENETLTTRNGDDWENDTLATEDWE